MMVEHSTASKSLRAVSLAILLVSVVAVSTVAYSAYQEYVDLSSTAKGPRLTASATLLGDSVEFKANGTVPNGGLYPIAFQVGYEATTEDGVLGQGGYGPVYIQAGQNETFNGNATVDLLGSGNVPAESELLLNGSTVRLVQNLTAQLQPFAGISISKIGRAHV